MTDERALQLVCWLQEQFQPRRFETFQVLDRLLDAVVWLDAIQLKAAPEDTVLVDLGEVRSSFTAPMAWSKVRMVLAKMGGYYLAQVPDPDCKALYGFDGHYRHKVGAQVVTYAVTSQNDEGQVPTLRIVVELCET